MRGRDRGSAWTSGLPSLRESQCRPRFVRVQVKSTGFKDRGGYSCTVRGSRGPYTGDPFDFLAAYLIPEDVWYIIPAEKFLGQGSIALYPKLKNSKYGQY
jgi:hypothetical protein